MLMHMHSMLAASHFASLPLLVAASTLRTRLHNVAKLPLLLSRRRPLSLSYSQGGNLSVVASVHCLGLLLSCTSLFTNSSYPFSLELAIQMTKTENHRYVPIDASNPEGQYVDGKDPCSSGRNGDSGGMSRSEGRQAHESGDALMEDAFYLESVGHVTVTLSDTHLSWRFYEDDSQKLVSIKIRTREKEEEWGRRQQILAMVVEEVLDNNTGYADADVDDNSPENVAN